MRFKILLHNIKQTLISIDQGVCCIIGLIFSTIGLLIPKFSVVIWADETFSSRCYRWSQKGITLPIRIVDAIFSIFGDIDHCKNSYLSEIDRNQSPPETRKELKL